MSKQGDIEYPDSIGDEGRRHALEKPFSDAACGRYLRDIGTVLELLPPPPARILDLGAGTAWTSIFLARRGYEVTAVDISPGMIALARHNKDRHHIDNLELQVLDYERMSFDGEFDAPLFFDALHHAENEESALRAALRALKPGGCCLTIEPQLGHADAATSVEAVARYRTTEKDMHPAHIVDAARAAGFRRFDLFEHNANPRLLCSSASMDLPAVPSRAGIAVRYLASGLRCLFFGKKQRDPERVGFPPSKIFLRSNILRLYK